MTKLMVDPALEAKHTAPAELTNQAGRTVGFFLTPEEHERLRKLDEGQSRLDYAHAQTLFTDEKWKASNREGGEHTTEVVAHLLDSNA